MQRILIVLEGQGESAMSEDYKVFADRLKGHLDMAEESGFKKAGEIMIVKKASEAEQIIRQERVNVVIFLSRTMEIKAGEMAAAHPNTSVLIVADRFPEGKIVWVQKNWLSWANTIRELIFYANQPLAK